jgi:GT2 family glycosyltransferase
MEWGSVITDREEEMNNIPRITVIIVNWNAGAYIERCLSCLQQQTLLPARIIVVDNNSTDGSLDRIEAYFKDIEIIRLGENTGFAAANNLAVKAANGSEWIALLNPDAFPEPDWLSRLSTAAQEFPVYTCFASRTIMADAPDLLDGAGDMYHVSGLALRRGYGCPADRRYSAVEEIFSACAAAALYRRDVFLDVGGFDEDYFCYLEDVDLGFRLRLAGHRCLYVPDAVVYHAGSVITGKRSDFYVYHSQRNLIWTFVKDMPTPLLLLCLPQHLMLNFASVCWFSLKGQAKVILKAIWDALRGMKLIWLKRNKIQAKRTVSSLALMKVMSKGFPKRCGT